MTHVEVFVPGFLGSIPDQRDCSIVRVIGRWRFVNGGALSVVGRVFDSFVVRCFEVVHSMMVLVGSG